MISLGNSLRKKNRNVLRSNDFEILTELLREHLKFQDLIINVVGCKNLKKCKVKTVLNVTFFYLQ